MARPISAKIPTNTPEGKSAYMKDWWAKNKDKKRKYDMEYHVRHRSSSNERSRKYYAEHTEEQRERQKAYSIANKDKLLPMWEKHYRARRARLAGVASEHYTKQQIYDRDSGICHLCGKSIDITIKWPNSKSFSFDHVVPLSMGGSDLASNIKSSHLKCNIGTYSRMRIMEQYNG
jgi:hypothetical protein